MNNRVFLCLLFLVFWQVGNHAKGTVLTLPSTHIMYFANGEAIGLNDPTNPKGALGAGDWVVSSRGNGPLQEAEAVALCLFDQPRMIDFMYIDGFSGVDVAKNSVGKDITYLETVTSVKVEMLQNSMWDIVYYDSQDRAWDLYGASIGQPYKFPFQVMGNTFDHPTQGVRFTMTASAIVQSRSPVDIDLTVKIREIAVDPVPEPTALLLACLAGLAFVWSRHIECKGLARTNPPF